MGDFRTRRILQVSVSVIFGNREFFLFIVLDDLGLDHFSLGGFWLFRGLVCIRAAIGLARVGDQQSVPYLIELLEREEETDEVKRFVARSLGILLNVTGAAGLSIDPEPWRKRAKDAGILQSG